MKRSRSGARSGAKKPRVQPKFRYELVRFDQHGDLHALNNEEMAAFKSKNPAFANKWMTPASENTEEVTWQSECRKVLDGIMVGAPRSRLPPLPRVADACRTRFPASAVTRCGQTSLPTVGPMPS